MKRELFGAGGVTGSVWAFLEFGIIHSPELLGVVSPLLRLARTTAWLPVDPLRKARLVVLVLVVVVSGYTFLKRAQERFNL
jgi:hypothetical protein